MTTTGSIGIFLAAMGAALAIDQMSKGLAGRRLADDRLHVVGWASGFRLALNARGAALALSPGQAAVTLFLALAGSAFVLAGASDDLDATACLGLGLGCGGATSNLADRIRHGAVVDFIAVGCWPTFNLADGAMVIGAGLIASSLL